MDPLAAPEEPRRFDPTEWEGCGLRRGEARQWWEHGFDAPQARAWVSSGICELADARGWRTCGLEPPMAEAWRRAAFDSARASGWIEHGFSLEEASRHRDAGRSPSAAYRMRGLASGSLVAGGGGRRTRSGARVLGTSGAIRLGPGGGAELHRFIEAVGAGGTPVVKGYLHSQWLDEEAIAWARRGIEAADARVFSQLLGLMPAEAARLTEQGLGPLAVARTWWEAGIPHAEVAAWIGAGLTAAEAAAHRAQGISAERAAVLRSLQGGEPGA